MKPIDLTKLFAKLKKGNRNATAFFYGCYRPLIESFLRRYTRKSESAQELADDAFFLVVSNIGDVQNVDHFLHLLYSTAWELFKGDGGPDDGPRLPKEVELAEKYFLFIAYSQFLPPRKQDIVFMRLIEGVSNKAIAMILSIKPQTVRNHISQSRKILSERFPRQRDRIDVLFQ